MSSYGLEVLAADECEALLAHQTVGRVAICTGRPAILPVLFALDDGHVVFRTAPGEKLIAAALHRSVVFEVDSFDVATREGWSVNVIGTAEEILHPDDLRRAHELDLPSWVDGDVRDRFVRILREEISGRRIRPRGELIEG